MYVQLQAFYPVLLKLSLCPQYGYKVLQSASLYVSVFVCLSICLCVCLHTLKTTHPDFKKFCTR